ncbi:atpase protein [Cystoisospora suis]|uniref:RNA cytidine acetyltransferase n=1 Tax=Cystoisospora suis TaxID=483139 RepID=A0A2C6KUE9_9APIC|nr:atpase protein [Cystoisospora suis]
MRKRVDARVKVLVENCIELRHRAFFVIIGDRGSEQVVNLHYLLHRFQPAHKPTVLWCYKKDLGFSSHRRKRAKQLKKKVQRGLYDPNIDDPFELFVSSTDIRYCYYKDSHSVLGSTYSMCVLQDFEALTPNILCRTVETVQGGGIVCLLLRSLSSLQQLYDLSMDIHSRFKTERFSQIQPRFNERFLLSLAKCQNCLIVDDELNVLPLNSFAQHIAPLKKGSGSADALGEVEENEGGENKKKNKKKKAEQLEAQALLARQTEQQRRELRELQSQFADTPQPVGSLMNMCVTTDQAKAVLAFLDCLATQQSYNNLNCRKERTETPGETKSKSFSGGGGGRGTAGGLQQTFALTAARGRGKSAALGLAVAAAVAYDYSSIFVCAPSAENVKTLFDFLLKGLGALGLKEHTDFDVHREDPSGATSANASHSSGLGSSSTGSSSDMHQRGSGNRLITKVTVRKHHRQTVTFISPDKRDGLTQADLLVVDEAASIPLPLVKSLFGPYVVLLSSTVNGYEGTGRALSLKLIQDLKQNKFASSSSSPPRTLKELTLSTPIRYSAGDGVEAWLHDLLCLDATEPMKLSEASLPPASKCRLYLVNRDALFSYHEASEAFLHGLLSLFVSSHYKNTPNDLMLMADAPAHLLFAFLPPVDEHTDTVPDIYCAIQVSVEGALSRQAIQQALGRGLRPSGDLLPWTLSQQFVDEDFGSLTGVRVVRVACHPSLQRMGYGSAALQQLIDFFEMKGCSIEEPDAVKSSLLAAEKKGEEGAEEEEDEDEDEEEEQEDDEEEGDGEEEEEESVTSRKKGKHRSKTASDKPATPTSSEDQASSPSSAFLSSLSRKSLKPRPAPPLLSPCSSTLPDFQIDYFGVAFGLTAQLFRFWSRKQFVPVYIRQVATDVTGEFSCIMLRHAALPSRSTKRDVKEKNKDKSAINGTDDDALMKKNLWQGIDITGGSTDKEFIGRADGSWLFAFAADFRSRFLQLLGGPSFRFLPASLALCVVNSTRAPAANNNPDGQEGSHSHLHPKVSLSNLPHFLSSHDLLRLRHYAKQLADLPLILDLLPVISSLFFSERLSQPDGIQLSHLQQAILLAVGAQKKTPDCIAAEFNIPPNQTLALLNKTIHKFVSFFQKLQEERAEAEVDQQWGAPSRRLVVEGGGGLLGELPDQSFADELAAGAKEVKKQQKMELKDLLNALGGEKALKASTYVMYHEHSMDAFTDADFDEALRGRRHSKGSAVLSLKKKAKPTSEGVGEEGDYEGQAKKRMKKTNGGPGPSQNGLPSKKKHKIYADR